MLYLFSLYLLLIVKITLLPIAIGNLASPNMSFIQLIPFFTIIDSIRYGTFLIQIIVNILLFIPFPIIMLLFLKHQNNTFKKTIISGIIMICSIEILQIIENVIFGSTLRIFDIDDIILNFTGIIIGFIICKIIKECKRQSSETVVDSNYKYD